MINTTDALCSTNMAAQTEYDRQQGAKGGEHVNRQTKYEERSFGNATNIKEHVGRSASLDFYTSAPSKIQQHRIAEQNRSAATSPLTALEHLVVRVKPFAVTYKNM